MWNKIKSSEFQSLKEVAKTMEQYSVLSWFWLFKTRYIDNKNNTSLLLAPVNPSRINIDELHQFEKAVTDLHGNSDWINSFAPLLMDCLVYLKPDLPQEEAILAIKKVKTFEESLLNLLTDARSLSSLPTISGLSLSGKLDKWLTKAFEKVHLDASKSLGETAKARGLTRDQLLFQQAAGVLEFDYNYHSPRILIDTRANLEKMQKRIKSNSLKRDSLKKMIYPIYKFATKEINHRRSEIKRREFYKTILPSKNAPEYESEGVRSKYFGVVFTSTILRLLGIKNLTLDEINDALSQSGKNSSLTLKTTSHRGEHSKIFKRLDRFHEDLYGKHSSRWEIADYSLAYEAFTQWASRSELTARAVMSYKAEKQDWIKAKELRLRAKRKKLSSSKKHTAGNGKEEDGLAIKTIAGITGGLTMEGLAKDLDGRYWNTKPPFILKGNKMLELFYTEQE